MLTVVGVSGPITAQTTVTVQVVKQQRADFTVAANPGTVSITTGATGSTVLTVLSKKGFNSPVALSANWQGPNPGGVSFTLQSPVTPTSGSAATSTLTITATPAAVPGTYTLIVTGSSGALLHTAQVTIVISQLITTTTTSTTSGSTPQCFIATATYGSPLAPEVQFLRTFRDREIMSTYVGWNFMIVFNAWYYSFSPSVAQSITQHATFQGAMKLILYPAITILRLGVTPFVLFPAHRELAAVLSGLLVSTMIGLVYLTIPAALILGRANRARRIGTRMEKGLAMVLAVSLLAIVTAEFSSSGILMMLSSVTAILSTLTLSTLLSSQALVQVIRSRTHQ